MSAWTDLGLLVVGGVLSQAGAVSAQLLNRSKEREARKDERAVARESESRNFQRETLLELQEALHREMRALGATHAQDLKVFRQDDGAFRWRGRKLGPELNDEAHQAGVRVLMLVERVLDEEVRELVGTAHNRISHYETSQTEEQGWDRVSEAYHAYEAASKRLGEVLRGLL